ncbi:MAG: hypothetical protein MJK10_07795 [Pseudomonadales bacterium]|nr:hypothetical protein [Pseudomonadales bacterium]NRA15726.1 hypothetical protein [Oceanospirillaceae bacterium]
MPEQQPKKDYQPIFNRSYLKYLGFVVAIAIVFLSEKSPQPLQQPQSIELSKSGLQQLQVDDLEQHRLLLSFNSNPALTSNELIQRQLNYQALRKSAADTKHIHGVLWTYDRLEIELRWNPQQPIAIADTLQQLVINSYPYNSAKAEKLIAAKYYLQSKQPQQLLLNSLNQSLASHYYAEDRLQQMLNKRPAALLFTAPTEPPQLAGEIDRQLAALFPLPRPKFPEASSWQKKQLIASSRTEQSSFLAAMQLGQLSNEQNQIELLSNFVLSRYLQQHPEYTKINFRLIRQPIFQRGYQLLIVFAVKPIAPQLLQRISSDIGTISPGQIEDHLTQVKDQLLQQYKSLLADRERRLKLYSKKQFYRLNTQSDSEYSAHLDTIDAEQISWQIRKLFGENTISIRLQQR